MYIFLNNTDVLKEVLLLINVNCYLLLYDDQLMIAFLLTKRCNLIIYYTLNPLDHTNSQKIMTLLVMNMEADTLNRAIMETDTSLNNISIYVTM
jgi:hypothetical protein